MANPSTEHLIKCISEKDKYKLTSQYIKEVEQQNESFYDYFNEALYNILVTNNYPPTSKLYALRLFKDLFISAQFQLIDGLHEKIIKQIVKVCQFDKENPDKSKRGSSYFEQIQKRKKENDSEKVSFSFVLFATEIIYVLGNWHSVDQNHEPSDYFVILEKLKKAKVPFPSSDKELKFFKPEDKQLFMKNYKQWIQKLPEIEQESDEGDEKENSYCKSRKIVKSKNIIPTDDKKLENIITNQAKTLKSQDQNQFSQTVRENSLVKQEEQALKAQTLNQSQLKNLKEINEIKDNQIIKLRNNLEQIMKEKDAQNKKILEEPKNQQELKSRYQALQIKYFTLQGKYNNLEKNSLILQNQDNQNKITIQQQDSIRQKQSIQFQKQKQMLQKKIIEKIQEQKKIRITLKQSSQQLNQAKQKISRLERQIQQLNDIKNSYKNIMIDNNSNVQDNLSERVIELQRKIEDLGELHAQQIIQLKATIKQITYQNQQLLKEIKIKELEVQSLKNPPHQICQNQKSLESQILKINNNYNESKTTQQEKLQKDLLHPQPELKTPIQPRLSNSMSQYLESQTSLLKRISQEKQSHSISKIQPHNRSINISLGKTQKSLQKRKQTKNRCQAIKTFHFAKNENYKNFQSKEFPYQHKPYLNLTDKKGHSSSSGSLWNEIPASKIVDSKQQSQTLQSFSKKSSALLLDRRSLNQKSMLPKQNSIQTLIPYIGNYFNSKSVMNCQDSFIFRSLCLSQEKRSKQSIYRDDLIQIKLLNNKFGSKEIYLLQIMNISHTSLKINIVSCHDQFKILGQKTRLIHSNSIGEYKIQTKIKDLNLRYPIVSLIVTQNTGNKVKNLTYNIPLPLTMLQFTEMQEQIPKFYFSETSNLKVLKSQNFLLNPQFFSLKECFESLGFKHKSKQNCIDSKQSEVIWEGNLRHRFIENVNVYLKMTQVGNQVSLQFRFKDSDQISQNYSKVMIQTLMFLLQ